MCDYVTSDQVINATTRYVTKSFELGYASHIVHPESSFDEKTKVTTIQLIGRRKIKLERKLANGVQVIPN